MSADLPRIAIVQWTNAQGQEEEITTAVHGHGDSDLQDWARAFKDQHPKLAAPPAGATDYIVYIELDLD